MKHTREYRNSGKTRTPVELSKRFLLVRYRQRQRKLFFWTDNSTPTVTNPSSANLETQKIQGEEVKGGKKKKRSPALKSSRREGSLKRDRPLLQLLLDSHSPFEDVNISASLWKQLAACVFLQSFCGDFLSRKHLSEPSDYRAAQLSARPVGLIT